MIIDNNNNNNHGIIEHMNDNVNNDPIAVASSTSQTLLSKGIRVLLLLFLLL